jgi:AraC-like DNA-binding protein
MGEVGCTPFSAELMAEWGLANRRFTREGVTLWEFDLPPGSIPAHEHLSAFFNVLLRGHIANHCAVSQVELPARTAVFHPAGTSHATVVGPQGATLLTLEADGSWLARVDATAPLPEAPRLLGTDAVLTRRLRRELRLQDPCSPLVVEGLMLLLLARAARGTRRREPLERALDRAVELLHEELAEPLSLGELAARAGLPAARLAAGFRARFGYGPGEYLRRLRVAYVRERLSGDAPLAVLALEAGFADQAHCTRVFKRLVGVPPGAYRRLQRGPGGAGDGPDE